jgi:glyceraldehyde 3-phosphate dehydrogenase/glyceraldehyde-3-phosphate dehydrogenase (NAD(P))
MKNIAVNGLGRIGRLIMRHYVTGADDSFRIVAANDLTPLEELEYLFKFDSAHGHFPKNVSVDSDGITLGDDTITVFHEREPEKLPWKELGVDVVLECTGVFRSREGAARHITAGASKVIISSPSSDADLTMVMGVNNETYDPGAHHVISNASCTTNSLAPAAKVLNDAFGIESLLATTIHAYTASQSLVDKAARKRRRGRAAAISLIPTSTGAAKATELVLPELAGKMDAMAVRAPVLDGAITDIVAHLASDVTEEKINAAFKKAADGELRGILQYSEDELVSIDIIGNPHSSILDAPSTTVIPKDRLAKVLVWYDNEYGYAARMLDLASYLMKQG